MSEPTAEAAARPDDDVPDLLEKAAKEIEKKDRMLELQGAQLTILSLVDRLLAAGGSLKPPPMTGEGYPTICDTLRNRAKSIKRVRG